MQKFLAVAVVIALGASVVLGVVSINHLSLIEDLEDEKAGLESDVSDLESEVQDQQSAIEDLEARPAVNPRELVQLLSDLRVDVDGLASDVDGFAVDLGGITSRLDDVEFQIERPPGCFAGDPVYWATGFETGLTC